jgi:hypothetical protein
MILPEFSVNGKKENTLFTLKPAAISDHRLIVTPPKPLRL